MKLKWVYCVDIYESLGKNCCNGCHMEEEEGYPSPMMDYQPKNNAHNHPSNIRGYGCCIFHNLSRDDWAKVVKYKRKNDDF
jgi:hypothetical protein